MEGGLSWDRISKGEATTLETETEVVAGLGVGRLTLEMRCGIAELSCLRLGDEWDEYVPSPLAMRRSVVVDALRLGLYSFVGEFGREEEWLLGSLFESREILACLPLPVLGTLKGLIAGLEETAIKAAPWPLRDVDLEGDLKLPAWDIG